MIVLIKDESPLYYVIEFKVPGKGVGNCKAKQLENYELHRSTCLCVERHTNRREFQSSTTQIN